MWGEQGSARIYVNTERHRHGECVSGPNVVYVRKKKQKNSGDAAVTGEVCLTTVERPYMSGIT